MRRARALPHLAAGATGRTHRAACAERDERRLAVGYFLYPNRQQVAVVRIETDGAEAAEGERPAKRARVRAPGRKKIVRQGIAGLSSRAGSWISCRCGYSDKRTHSWRLLQSWLHAGLGLAWWLQEGSGSFCLQVDETRVRCRQILIKHSG